MAPAGLLRELLLFGTAVLGAVALRTERVEGGFRAGARRGAAVGPPEDLNNPWSFARPFCVLPQGLFATGRAWTQFIDEGGFGEKQQALLDANLTCEQLSLYGAYAPKVSGSVVKQVEELKSKMTGGKTSRFNFQGAATMKSIPGYGQHLPGWQVRYWLKDFAQRHFTDTDIYIDTYAEQRGKTPLGLWDHSLRSRGRDRLDYYRIMAKSTFTLCPAGDMPWSMRFYEAILAGSIPVIQKIETDLSDGGAGFYLNKVGYKFFTTDQVRDLNMSSTELKRMSDDNYSLFLRYQTFVQGDHVPPAYTSFLGHSCLSNELCKLRCLQPHLSPDKCLPAV